MNMWKSVRGGNCCWCKKFKEMEINNKQQKRKNIFPSKIIDFLATNNLITKLTLHTQHAFFENWCYASSERLSFVVLHG